MRGNHHQLSDDAILTSVRRHLGAIIGGPELACADINMASTFGRDLELESIEFVALADKLRAEYGERINFASFLADKNVDDIVSLTVGDVVHYVAACLQEEAAVVWEAEGSD